MPANLLPHLRLLQPSLSPAMKLVHSSRSIPIFSRIFPFKLKYHALLYPLSSTQLPLRSLSTHPFRRRTDSTRRAAPRASPSSSSPKSLIEDEAELSDWVSELRTDSFRGRLTSDEDDDDDDNRGRRVSKRRGENKEDSRNSNRDSYSFARKRNREIDSDEDSFSGRNRRSSDFDMNSRRSSQLRGRFDCEMDGKGGNYSRQKFEKGKMSSLMGRREGRELDSRGGQSGRGNAGSLRRNVGVMSKYEEEDGDRDEEEEEGMKGFGSLSDLISEESSEDAGDDSDDGDKFVRKSESALFGSESEGAAQNLERVSGGKSDSYLSETRYAMHNGTGLHK